MYSSKEDKKRTVNINIAAPFSLIFITNLGAAYS